MKFLSDGVVLAGKIAIADFICPTKKTREEFNADFSVWMDTIKEGRFEDTNKLFEKPTEANYYVKEWLDDTPSRLEKLIKDSMGED